MSSYPETKEVAPASDGTRDTKQVFGNAEPVSTNGSNEPPPMYPEEEVIEEKKPWWNGFLVMGSVLQIITAALLAIAIGMAVTSTVDEVPEAARVILSIPGDLWLRALKAVGMLSSCTSFSLSPCPSPLGRISPMHITDTSVIVLPLIVCAMIMAVQRLRTMSKSGALLARWTIGWYVITTVFSIIMSVIMTSQVWAPRFSTVGAESLQLTTEQEEEFPDPSERPPHMVVLTLFQTLVTDNVIKALAEMELLAVLIVAVVIGYLIRDDDSVLLKLVVEIEKMITKVITFLIKLAPIGVFFLILPNLMKLDISEIGENLGYLIGGTLTTMALHVFVILPALFFGFTRQNPYSFWLKISPAWITAWGCASSAATLPVTLRVARERGIPQTVYKFTCPLGCLINMDG